MEEPTGLIAVMRDLEAGKSLPSSLCDFSAILAEHAAKQAAAADRDLVDEAFHRYTVGKHDPSDGALGRWLHGL
jgi:hypothetical protein